MTVNVLSAPEKDAGESWQLHCPEDCDFCSSPETD
jgi:hypothetical protein